MQLWRKLGRIFTVSPNASWMMTHAAVPTANIVDNRVRVYFGTRNANKQASVGYFEFNPSTPTKIGRVSEKPCLSPGALGTFDDSGVLPSWIANRDGKIFMYYIGWNLGVTVPFRNFTGLAVSDDGGETFRRYSQAPIADRDEHDPYFFTNPCLLREKSQWKIWYLSAVRWEEQHAAAPKHFYHIKADTSADGIRWDRRPKVAIDFKYPGEFAISRPCVLKDGNTYRMWYSYRCGPRGNTYRIGYAESSDGVGWTRMDEKVGLDVSSEGWDSESVEYAHVFDHGGQRYMLFNGNNFGETGIGLAVLDSE